MADNTPLILVCNDDGITAPGIRNLAKTMCKLGDVYVVAPDGPQSGMGHAITINGILRCDPIDIDGDNKQEFSCSGTPVDCVKLAVNRVLPRKPDLVVSGINHGSNSSINVIYSGTMSAAVEGSLEDIPSVGFSLCDYSWQADFEPALPFVEKIAREVLEKGLPKGVCLNVNIPKPGQEPYRGIKICRQAKGNWVEEVETRTDPRGREYYWLTGRFDNQDGGEDSDEWALAHNFISIVPVNSDITDYTQLELLKNWNF